MKTPAIDLVYNDTIAAGFTQSEDGVLDSCGFQWNMRYNLHLEPRGKVEWWSLVGSGFHSFCDQWYRTGEVVVPKLKLPEEIVFTAEDSVDLQYWQTVLQAMCEAYAIYYKTDKRFFKIEFVEEEIDITVEHEGVNIRLRGKLDLGGRYEKSKFIMDHKSMGWVDASVTEGWGFRYQFMFYNFLARQREPKPWINDRFIANGMKKPQLRMKQGETPEAFAERTYQDILKRPDNYFVRQTEHITKEDIEHFERNILGPKLERYVRMQTSNVDHLILNKNTHHCFAYGHPCPYLIIRKNGTEELGNFFQRKNKHPEL